MSISRDLPSILKACAEQRKEQTAIRFLDRSMDFGTFDHVSDHIANGLEGMGIEKGDRVGLYCINSDLFAIAYFGIVKAGATVVPINLLLNPKEASWILNDAGAKALFYFEAFNDAVQGIKAELPNVSHYIRMGRTAALEGEYSFVDLISNPGRPPAIKFDPNEDVAAIIYTSGTTGKPKGAMLTHRNLASNTKSVVEGMKLRIGEDRLLVVLPMFHSFAATVGMLTPLLHGCTLIPLPKFDAQLVVDTVEAEGATILPMVPSMYNMLLRLPESETAKLKSLRYCVAGGAAMPVEIMKQFEERFGVLIYEGDGPTECSPVTSVNPIDGLRKPGSIGLTVPDVEMTILDDDGKEIARGEIGELCVRGPNIMKGYWNQPEETAATFFEDWLRTGDLGYQDKDDYFFIVDRKKDMIIVNGMNVYPRVVEEILYQFEPIREAAVVGEPSELHGEIPVAFVSLKEGHRSDVATIRTYCRDHLGRHEVPRKVEFMDELPKNATGKILKRELRKTGEIERGIDSRNKS